MDASGLLDILAGVHIRLVAVAEAGETRQLLPVLLQVVLLVVNRWP